MTLSRDETERWVKASAPIYEEWIDEMNKRGKNGVALLKDARELLAKHK
jgi:uncharacterized protein (DUF1810 family)